MFNAIWEKIILAILGTLVTGSCGYLSAKIKEYRNGEKVQTEALKCLLRSQITSKYYVYSELKSIPLYEKENINYMYEQYKRMGGNSYITEIMDELNSLPIKK